MNVKSNHLFRFVALCCGLVCYVALMTLLPKLAAGIFATIGAILVVVILVVALWEVSRP